MLIIWKKFSILTQLKTVGAPGPIIEIINSRKSSTLLDLQQTNRNYPKRNYKKLMLTLHTNLKIMPWVSSNRPPGQWWKDPFIQRRMWRIVIVRGLGWRLSWWSHHCELQKCINNYLTSYWIKFTALKIPYKILKLEVSNENKQLSQKFHWSVTIF